MPFSIATSELGHQMSFEQVQHIVSPFPSYSFMLLFIVGNYALTQRHNPSGIKNHVPSLLKKKKKKLSLSLWKRSVENESNGKLGSSI